MFVVMTVLTVLKVPFEKAAPPCPSDVPAPLVTDPSIDFGSYPSKLLLKSLTLSQSNAVGTINSF